MNVCERCVERPGSVTIHLSDVKGGPGLVRELCMACYGIEYPKPAANLRRLLARRRREKFAQPIDVDALRRRLHGLTERATPSQLAPLADQLAEHAATNGQALPGDIRDFIERYRSAPPATQ